jgi:hypothetical protein
MLNELMPPTGPALGAVKALDVRAMEAALGRVARNSDRTFRLLEMMVCALFVLDVAAFVVWASQPARAAALTAASGVTLPFLLYFLRDSWRTKVQADTLLVLAASLDPAVVQSIVRAFIDGMQKGDRSTAAMHPRAYRPSPPTERLAHDQPTPGERPAPV